MYKIHIDILSTTFYTSSPPDRYAKNDIAIDDTIYRTFAVAAKVLLSVKFSAALDAVIRRGSSRD